MNVTMFLIHTAPNPPGGLSLVTAEDVHCISPMRIVTLTWMVSVQEFNGLHFCDTISVCK